MEIGKYLHKVDVRIVTHIPSGNKLVQVGL